MPTVRSVNYCSRCGMGLPYGYVLGNGGNKYCSYACTSLKRVCPRCEKRDLGEWGTLCEICTVDVMRKWNDTVERYFFNIIDRATDSGISILPTRVHGV